MDTVRYCIILFVAAHLWEILGYIIEFSDGVTSAVGPAGGYSLSMGGDLDSIIHESLQFPEFELTGEWVAAIFETLGYGGIYQQDKDVFRI